MIAVFPYGRSDFNRANFFHGLLGANVVFANEEHNVPHELEGMPCSISLTSLTS